MKNIFRHNYRRVNKLICDWTDDNIYYTYYGNLMFYVEMGKKIDKIKL